MGLIGQFVLPRFFTPVNFQMRYFMKSVFTYSFVFINLILNGLYWWTCWLTNNKLPDNLGSESVDLVMQRYQNVRAEFAAWISISCVVVLVLVNVVVIWMCYVLNKKSRENN